MKLEKLSRKEKEDLLFNKMNEQQIRWGNSTDYDREWLKDLSDEQLEKGIKDTMGQLRFEKSWSFLGKSILYPIYIFIALGIIGLLVFGIRQIF